MIKARHFVVAAKIYLLDCRPATAAVLCPVTALSEFSVGTRTPFGLATKTTA